MKVFRELGKFHVPQFILESGYNSRMSCDSNQTGVDTGIAGSLNLSEVPFISSSEAPSPEASGARSTTRASAPPSLASLTRCRIEGHDSHSLL
jgi:hypothetical protein